MPDSRIAASPLGQASAYPERYDPALLYPIDRAPARAGLGIGAVLPFHGHDLWNAWELSWLDPRGKPVVALAGIRVPADSPALIESKSLKLYLNSFNGERMEADEAARRMQGDLSSAAGAQVAVALRPVAPDSVLRAELDGESLDGQELDIGFHGPPDSGLLQADAGAPVSESLVSDLFKSNCPVTGQPDWASIQIRYRGPRLDRAALLRYLVSFRNHSGFHEQCVEQIFVDIQRRCAPEVLSVHARYTRRGGLDINPFRSSQAGADPGNPLGVRQ